jgi:hypothetical protein
MRNHRGSVRQTPVKVRKLSFGSDTKQVLVDLRRIIEQTDLSMTCEYWDGGQWVEYDLLSKPVDWNF